MISEMSEPIPQDRDMTVEQYIALELSAEGRHQFRDGKVAEVPANTDVHDQIALRIWRLLADAVATDCEAFSIDLPVQTDCKGYDYPDVFVVNGAANYGPPGQRFAVTNPRVIVEVLSPETEVHDRSEKFRRYIAMESLQEFVLVAQDTTRIETFFKRPDGVWAFYKPLESLDDVWTSRSLPGVELPLAQIYAGVEFPPRPPEWTGDPAPDPARHYTVDEYLQFELATEWQYDFVDGEIMPKVHPNYDHGTIGTNLICELGNRFDDTPKECWLGSVRVVADVERCFLHPDLSITLEAAFLPPKDNVSLLNPIAVIEITSPETADDDRGRKFERYRQIDALGEYILIAADKPLIESFCRRPDGTWTAGQLVAGIDAVWKSDTLGIELPLADVYDGVNFKNS
jgi:Uma2 family endonuclease